MDKSYVETWRARWAAARRTSSGGRFHVVSILTTGTQLAFVGDLCNPSMDPKVQSAPIEKLLPDGVDPQPAR